jgi:cytidine deaminase
VAVEIIEAAKRVRDEAYAPYSRYKVGAAVLDDVGRVHVGCNVENVAYPVGTCAERAAIGAMVAAGGRKIREIVVATKDGGTPCGMCLQAIFEFADAETRVITVDESGGSKEYRLRELLPHGFSSHDVTK